jgi:putative SOS response-associated peptidase YedK
LLSSTWKGNASFAFAGIWEHWERDGKTLDSCLIIVTQANTLMKPIHDRMPVILSPDLYDAWMDPSMTEPKTLLPLLTPYPSDLMQLHPVRTTVNSPRHEGATLIEAVTDLWNGT